MRALCYSVPTLCAESCVSNEVQLLQGVSDASQAQQATSEEAITVDDQLCGSPNADFLSQIRADFTNCALPSNSLSQQCITGEENEPNDCGFSSNLQALCGYCASSSPNATDSCCAGSNVSSRCTGVTLPSTSSMPPLFPSSTGTATSAGAVPASTGGNDAHHGLSGGQIAGIAVGSVIGGLLLLALLVLCCLSCGDGEEARKAVSSISLHHQEEESRTWHSHPWEAAKATNKASMISQLDALLGCLL